MSSTPMAAAQTLDSELLDWTPLSPGLSFKPLSFFADGSGYQLLLRVEPGTVVERHRHTGHVHAFNLTGSREIIDTGQVIGPGTYVYEPVGNVDSWRAIGDQPCIIHIEANGAVEYLDDRDEVVRHTDAGTARARYLEWCDQTGVEHVAGFE